MDFFERIEQGVRDRFGQQRGDQYGQDAQEFGGWQGRGQSGALSQWGSSTFYGLKNVATGFYLAAHPDGQLVAEDDTTRHHDIPWSIYTTQDGRVTLKSCHSKYLDTDGQGLPTNNAEDPNQTTWELVEQDRGIYSLRSPFGQFLQAVAPNGEDQQVLLSYRCGQSEVWQIEPLSTVMGNIDSVEGRFF